MTCKTARAQFGFTDGVHIKTLLAAGERHDQSITTFPLGTRHRGWRLCAHRTCGPEDQSGPGLESDNRPLNTRALYRAPDCSHCGVACHHIRSENALTRGAGPALHHAFRGSPCAPRAVSGLTSLRSCFALVDVGGE